ncbi:MAG: glycosyltransferase family 4 protein [Cyanobacteriota bacterium]
MNGQLEKNITPIKTDKKASIVMLLQEYYPKDTRVRKEAQAILESGHNLDIICLKDTAETPFEVVDGVNVHRIDIPKKRGSKIRYIFEYFTFFALCTLKLNKLLKTKKFDIVHVHTLPDFLVFGSYPAKRKGAKVVLDMHEIMPEFFVSKYNLSENHIIIKTLKFIEKISLQYADYVITVNNQLKDQFSGRAKLKNDITIIMNTVDEETMPKIVKQQTDKFFAVYHGTITKLYNLDFAVRALVKIKDKIPNFEFHIYGDGNQIELLESLVKEFDLSKIVFIHGRVSHKAIPEILSKANLGILPIKKDIMSNLSFSNKLAEYVHYEIPVISSNLDSVMSYFPNDSIYYFKDNDEDDFCKQLLHIYNNYEESKNYVEKASSINKEISWNIMKEKLQNLVKIVNS